jgi:surfeit locus 1 family protein
LKKMFSRAWVVATLLVLGGTAFCIRMGVWQLDRLEQRRAFNAQVVTMRAEKMLDLTRSVPANISTMEWRAVTVTGEYDFEHQVTLRNQFNGDQYGYHLITPLRFPGGAVLVNRGFIPADQNSTPADWRKYDETGQVTITGQIRLGQEKPAFGGVADADVAHLDVWNNFDVNRISAQIPYPILSVFVQPNEIEGDNIPPISFQPEIELTEGPHFGYALQWFSFATILFFGYPFYLRKQQ